MNSQPLICAFTPTRNRPQLLGRMIKCFERQTYENRFLVIVDDAGQYENQSGDRWELVSFPRRVLTLGEKNNVAIALAPRGTWALAKMDDDDFYSPWHLEALVAALHKGPFCQPRKAIDFVNGEWVITDTFGRDPLKGAYHGCWGFTREMFIKFGGYRAEYAGDDQELQHRLVKNKVFSIDTPPNFKPSYWYNRPLANRISERGGSEAAYFWEEEIQYVGKVPEWTDETDWTRPIPRKVIKRQW